MPNEKCNLFNAAVILERRYCWTHFTDVGSGFNGKGSFIIPLKKSFVDEKSLHYKISVIFLLITLFTSRFHCQISGQVKASLFLFCALYIFHIFASRPVILTHSVNSLTCLVFHFVDDIPIVSYLSLFDVHLLKSITWLPDIFCINPPSRDVNLTTRYIPCPILCYVTVYDRIFLSPGEDTGQQARSCHGSIHWQNVHRYLNSKSQQLDIVWTKVSVVVSV